MEYMEYALHIIKITINIARQNCSNKNDSDNQDQLTANQKISMNHTIFKVIDTSLNADKNV